MAPFLHHALSPHLHDVALGFFDDLFTKTLGEPTPPLIEALPQIILFIIRCIYLMHDNRLGHGLVMRFYTLAGMIRFLLRVPLSHSSGTTVQILPLFIAEVAAVILLDNFTRHLTLLETLS